MECETLWRGCRGVDREVDDFPQMFVSFRRSLVSSVPDR